MSKIFFISFLFFTTISYSQKIVFDSKTLESIDPEIKLIRELWQSYILNNNGDDKFDYEKYWNQEEIAQGFKDIVIATTPFRSYFRSENIVTEIKKVDQYYVIRNNLILRKDTSRYFSIKFDIYTKRVGDGYKLFNSFYVNKQNLNHFQTLNINYYYLPSYDFNVKKAQSIDLEFTEICKKFGNLSQQRVTYIIGENLDEAYRNVGIQSTTFSSSSPYAGFYIEDLNMILSSREDHLHELVHTYFNRYHGSGILQEGIATYFGGTNGLSFNQCVNDLKKLILNNPDIDLSKYYSLDDKLSNKAFNTYYTIGAIFIDYAFKNGGKRKVLSLFKYEDVDSFDHDGLTAAVANELEIKRSEINKFLRDYILSYPKLK